ncbi:MAG: hypothetical protein H5U40_06655 [Polyangiaceae bacterium]|nr:hypothetical protein [Polyangiaceae bacterium]
MQPTPPCSWMVEHPLREPDAFGHGCGRALVHGELEQLAGRPNGELRACFDAHAVEAQHRCLSPVERASHATNAEERRGLLALARRRSLRATGPSARGEASSLSLDTGTAPRPS